MHNEHVRSYCEHYNLEILEGVFQNYVVEGDRLVAEFKNHEKGILFYNADGSGKTVLKKGDLIMFIIEGERAH